MSQLILYPTGDGTYINDFTPYPISPSTIYDKVDETIADDDSTYIEMTDYNVIKYCSFTKNTINNVLPLTVGVRVRAKNIGGLGFSGSFYGALIINGTIYSKQIGLITSYQYLESTTTLWTVNPATNNPWTLNDINNIEFGAGTRITAGTNGRITMVYLVVNVADNQVIVSDNININENIELVNRLTINDSLNLIENINLTNNLIVNDQINFTDETDTLKMSKMLKMSSIISSEVNNITIQSNELIDKTVLTPDGNYISTEISNENKIKSVINKDKKIITADG